MTLRHLKIFVAVVDVGSMTQAAAELHISQPTVSQAIAELEEHYHVKLFDRLSKRLYITDVGKQLLSYARHILHLFDQMDHVAEATDANSVIKVGASMTIGTCLLPDWIQSFSKTHPKIEIYAVIKNTRDIEQLLLKNTIDLAVVEGTVHVPELVAIPFMEDELVMVCGKSHRLYGSPPIGLSDLSGLGFLVREEGSGTRELFETVMAANDMPWQMLWACDGSDSLINAALSGIGIAVVSKKLVETELDSKALFALTVTGLNFSRKFSTVHHKDKYLTPAMKAFLARLQA